MNNIVKMQIENFRGPAGLPGAKGDKGDPGAKGDKGDKGDPFTYADFTPEQLAALKGEPGAKGDKGDKGDPGSGGSIGIRPEDYGAVGDGVADDRDALIAAMKASVEAKQPMVLTAGKTYKINRAWGFVGDFTLDGNGAVILSDITGMTGTNRNALSIWGNSNDKRIENLTIRNLTIRSADTCTSNYQMAVARCRNIVLDRITFDCDINTQSRSTLDLYGANDNILVENCTFRQLSAALEGGCWVREWRGDGTSRNIRFVNCDFWKAGGDEVLAVWGWKGTVKDVLISGCTFREVDDPKYWTNLKYYPKWYITLGQSGKTEVKFINNFVYSTHCECTFRMLGDNTHAIVDGCEIHIGQDPSIPLHNKSTGANMMLAQGNKKAAHTIIRNSSLYFSGDSGRRLTYAFGTVENCNMILDGLGGICAGTRIVRNNVMDGKSMNGGFNDCDLISGNKITLTGSNPQIFAGYGKVENNEIVIDVPSLNADGLPICSNNPSWVKSEFVGNSVKWTVKEDSKMRRYQYPDTTAFVRDNRFFSNAGFRAQDDVKGYLYRNNNFFNDMPEKLFPCTGIAFPENEITVNYKKKMVAVASPEPARCTDPIIYTFSGGDELLTLGGHGKYTVKKDGKATVTATCGSYDTTQTIKIQLLPAPCEKLYLSRTFVKTAVGRETYIKVVFEPYWTTDIVVFTSSDEDVFTITQDGTITAHALGNATIYATCGDKTAECAVEVVDPAELPVYKDGDWLLDGTVAYVPLPAVGEKHTLYIEMKVDLDTIGEEEPKYVRLFGTYSNADTSVNAPACLAFQYKWGLYAYDWETSESYPEGGKVPYYGLNYINTGAFTEESGAKIRFMLKPDGAFNINAERPVWETTETEQTVPPYSGYMVFNAEHDPNAPVLQSFKTSEALKAALDAGEIRASKAKGYKITRFILYSHDTYITQADVLKYREGADIDIRFDENGMPVNAGTSGTLVWSSGNMTADTPDESAETSALGRATLGTMRLGQ